jgi:hypothetical protein
MKRTSTFDYKVIVNMEITSTYDYKVQFLCSYGKKEYLDSKV